MKVHAISVVLNRGASINFQWGESPYVPYNMESLIIKFTKKCICFHSLWKPGGL